MGDWVLNEDLMFWEFVAYVAILVAIVLVVIVYSGGYCG